MQSFPYPVLGNSNDVEGRAEATVRVQGNATGYLATVDLSSTNGWFEQQVRESRLRWLVRAECSTTYWRRSFLASGATCTCEIASESVEGRVDLRPLLIAGRTEESYRPGGVNADYGAAVFQVDQGAIVGIGGSYSFDAEKQQRGGQSKKKALIRVRPSDAMTGPAEIVLDHQAIVVRIPGDDWQAFLVAKGFLPSMMAGAIGLPAIAEALRVIDKPEFEEYPWNVTLRQLVSDGGILIENGVFQAAQRILHDPLSAVLHDVRHLASSGAGDE